MKKYYFFIALSVVAIILVAVEVITEEYDSIARRVMDAFMIPVLMVNISIFRRRIKEFGLLGQYGNCVRKNKRKIKIRIKHFSIKDTLYIYAKETNTFSA